eukprot:gnl/TRDRNA2_/TRDRNA2_191111_c0_seq1.p1 gnl/TRDRNA2_/TRDRNA2_191111_c0~~gnl/TRDRNA2_/TRDRNA2_191111_c0_seq1.p1  ORF type:complete len:209 (-),score=60.63 gnl/TRDRNA2_/TRDRNA2_191111_c0_seq1:105-731(-)
MPPMTLLQVEPATELRFSKKDFTVSRLLKLSNSHSGHVAFKVKTTAPKSYLVRPSNGTLRPGEVAEVQIILQTGGGSPSDRFLVQAVPVAEGVEVKREQWAEYAKDAVQENKLNVVIEDEVSEAPRAPVANMSAATGESADLKVKYDELVQYTLMLENQKKKLEASLRELQGSSPAAASKGGGYSSVHIVLVALIAFLLSYAAKFLSP